MSEPERARGDRRGDPGVLVDGPAAGGAAPEALRLLLEDSAEDLYENAPCGYLSTLMDGTIVKVNETLLAWTRLRRTDLVGKVRFPDLLTVGGRIFYETHLAPMLRLQQGVREIALDLVTADGQTLPVLVNSRVRTDDTGTPVVVRTMVLDATERTAYERQLLTARRQAEQSEAQVRALQQVAGELAAASAVEAVAAVAARAGRAVFDAAHSELWSLHEETRELVPAGAGCPQPPPGAGPARVLAQALRDGEAIVAEPGEPGDRVTKVALPLVVDRAQLGVLCLELTPPRHLSASDRTALVTFAGQFALALSRVRLHEQTVLASARSATLARVGRELDETQGLVGRAERLSELVAQEVADVAVVLLPAPTGGWQTVAVHPGLGGDATAELQDEAAWAAAASRAVQTDSPQVLDDVDPAPGAGTGVAGRGVVVPLRARGRGLGALVVLREGGPFWSSELPFLVDLADRGGLALENARLYEQERDVAHTLQRSLLPERLPTDERIELVPHYRPAVEGLEVGGDWYDAFETAPGVVAVVVGDVVGRGVTAASAMGQLRSAIRALATTGLGPAALLERLDAFVEHAESAQMATVAYVQLDLATGRARYACAGHLPPLLLGAAGAQLLWGGRSAPLGALAGAGGRAEDEVVLPRDARLLLYTDGLVERRRRSLTVGLDRLVAEAGARRELPLTALVPAVTETLLADAEHADDVCVLALHYQRPAVLELTLPADVRELRGARAALRRWLTGVGVDGDDLDALVLATSEALANAMEHGCAGSSGCTVQLRAVRTSAAVEIRVTDPGRPGPRGGAAGAAGPPWSVGTGPTADTDAGGEALLRGERGRGMLLMRGLVDSVRVRSGEGTEVVLRHQPAPRDRGIDDGRAPR